MDNQQDLLSFYRAHLHQVIMPFWMQRAIDDENGGYFTCFDNTGSELKSTDKYVWAQGRFVWVLSKLYEMHPQDKNYIEAARSGVNFLIDNAFLADGTCAFVLTKTGEPREKEPGAGYHRSFFADCFVVIGLSKYAAVTGDGRVMEEAAALYESIIDRIEAWNIKTDPYPIPEGYKAHGVPMISLNTGQELLGAFRRNNDPRAERVKEKNSGFVQEIMNDFVRGTYLLEMVGRDGQPKDTILGSYVNPGHTIEDMWFIMHHAMEENDKGLIEQAAMLSREALRRGWDETYGGLFQFIHKDGGPPWGGKNGIQDSAMVKTVENNWSNKLWWPHSEALYTLLLGHHLTGDSSLMQDYEKVFDYTFTTFPNPDKETGEWIQIRDRRGRPESKCVALPVKDPYHITRNLMLIIELLSAEVF